MYLIQMFLLITNKLLVLWFHVTAQPDAKMSGPQLSNGMPRRAVPLPFSSPPQLEVSALDQVDLEGKFSF